MKLIDLVIGPFLFPMFVNEIFQWSNIMLGESWFCFTVCIVELDFFGNRKLFRSSFKLCSFVWPYLLKKSFGCHSFESTSCFYRGFDFFGTNSWNFVWKTNCNEWKVYTVIVLRFFVHVSNIFRPDFVYPVGLDFYSNKVFFGAR